MRLVDADALERDGWALHRTYQKDATTMVHETKNIKDIPTIEPERKTGEWVNARDGYDGHVKCTGCFKTYDWTSQAQYYNFCPNCGADMRGEQNE